ncbi:flagellar motor protein MotD [Vogesella fluminis]|uniref:Flagellar motor protein MotD n=1 Tax=Vogesella fluminis TaxID=1069161 RepID=A0ABQ3H809_9NEIS|nr:flagellar motor protein MotD [Vogesella fluminis]GHD75422.1 flagellar motor protein MotD [Vogesella fluminis]
MARRRKQEEVHENHERWLVSYADFITLLFAFFVVMYAISQVNEGKYRVLSTSMIDAFRSGNLAIQATPPSGSANTMIEIPDTKPIATAVEGQQRLQERARLKQLADDIGKSLAPLMQGGQVSMRQDDEGIHIEIKDTALFPVGQALPTGNSPQILSAVAQQLAQVSNEVRVEGFTDNIPIRNAFFPSNWELSAARAGSIVRLFMENGIAPERLVAIGRAETMPAADNASADGRARNRRVAITIIAKTSGKSEDIAAATAAQPGKLLPTSATAP